MKMFKTELNENFDFTKTCRLCLNQTNELISIFDKSSFEVEYSIIVSQCTDVMVTEQDELPKNICLECVECSNKLYQFRKLVVNSEHCLNDYLNKFQNNFNADVIENTTNIKAENFDFDSNEKTNLPITCLIKCEGLEQDSELENKIEIVNEELEIKDENATLTEPTLFTSNSEGNHKRKAFDFESNFKYKSSLQTFTEKIDLKNPEKIHIFSNLKGNDGYDKGEKLYSCKECGKSFSQLRYLKTHEKSHKDNLSKISNKRKSYSTEFKLKAVEHSEKHGTLSAATLFGVNDSMIRRWKNLRLVLKSMNKSKKARRYGKVKWPELEQQLSQWIIQERNKSQKVSTVKIRMQAKRMAAEMGLEGFKGGPNWCYCFMKRKGLSTTSKLDQYLPENHKELVAEFRNFVKRETSSILAQDLGNMDEIPASFDIQLPSGQEKLNFTTVLCVTSDGHKCPPMIIFKSKTLPINETFPEGVVVRANEKGWINERLMEEWVENCWICRCCNPAIDPNKSLLIIDSARNHLTENSKKILKKRSKLAIVPGGMRKLLQPIDISVTKLFKNRLQYKWEEWVLNSINHAAMGQINVPTYLEICRWVLESFRDVSVRCIQNGFRQVLEEDENGVNEIDEDEELYENEEADELLVENLPEDICETFDSIINFVSDDEFEGF